jgi:HEAT repeat protein
MNAQEIEALFAKTLSGDYEDESPWGAVRALRQLGTREVFYRAVEWSESEDPLRRARGIDVLAQLGKTVDPPANSFPEEAYSIVSHLVQRERDPRPLCSAIAALGHLDNSFAIPLIVGFAKHPNCDVRFQVACALGSFPNDSESVNTLLLLTSDSDEEVRDWAIFGLGVLGDADSTDIRDALFLRLSDSNEDAREEAMVSLSKRQDQRVLPTLMSVLREPLVTDRVIEAAYLILGMEAGREDWGTREYELALRDRFSL